MSWNNKEENLRGMYIYNTVFTVNYVHAICNPNINIVVYQTLFPMGYAPRTQSSHYKIFLSLTGSLCVVVDIFLYVLASFLAIWIFSFPFLGTCIQLLR
jgi:hypothetical protein